MMRRSMRNSLLAALAACLVSLPGCMKVHDDVTIEANGSGTMTSDVELDLTAFKEIDKEMKKMGAPGADGPGMDGPKPEEKEPPKEDPLVKLKQEWKDIPGIEITNATAEEKDGKVAMHVEAKFTSFEAYAKASEIESDSELVKNADGSYTLKFTTENPMGGGDAPPPAKPDAPAMADEPKPAGMDDAKPGDDPFSKIGEMLGPIIVKALSGLEYHRKITVPGTIVETNGTKGEDGASVSWKTTFKDMEKPKAEGQFVTFKGEGLDLKPFKVVKKSKFEMGGPPGAGPGPGGPGGGPMGK